MNKNLKFLYVILILLFLINCGGKGEIIAKKSETELPVILQYQDDFFWQLSIPFKIRIENSLDNGLNFDGIQQLSNSRGLKLYKMDDDKIQDLRLVSDIIEMKQSKEYIVFAAFSLKNNPSISQELLKNKFINEENKDQDSILIGTIQQLRNHKVDFFESLLKKDTFFLEFSRMKPNIGFEKPIKIPLH